MESNTIMCTIDETNPDQLVDCYKINEYQGKKITIKLTQKDYNTEDPTCFSLTFAWLYEGMTYGTNLEYNYITSVVS